MHRSEARLGVRMMKFLNILGRYEAAEFSQLEAAALLGVGERTFLRWRQRCDEDGEAGLLDGRPVRDVPMRGVIAPVRLAQKAKPVRRIGPLTKRGQFRGNHLSGLNRGELGETRGIRKLTAAVTSRKRPACRVTATLGPQKLH
jgi:hypothetical protein